ncbi:MAG TPA: EAL domain-containing protein [Luteibacter sp.]|uniref:EAL domain-containing protein n=1 Tax=Luteibacter sp. TaxID=1886636 RepID=UPI002CEF1F18|nr:EAL domain-containing protein [Luteibacter sp.]HVI57201.1 EAL domain-containing protein [Luteibacter sp.]
MLRTRRIRLTTWGVALGLTVGLVTLVAILQVDAYRGMLASGRRQLGASAGGTVRMVDQDIDASLGPLLALRNAVVSADPGPLHMSLAEVQARHPELSTFVALDGEGGVLACTDASLMNWRENFRAPRREALGASVRVVVADGQGGVPPAIRVLVDSRVAAPAAFGTVIDEARVREAMSRSAMGASADMAVFSLDGRRFAGNRVGSDSTWTGPTPNAGASGLHEDDRRLYAWAASPHYPFAVQVGLERAGIFDEWVHQARPSMLATLALVLLLNAFAAAFDRAYRRQSHLIRALSLSTLHQRDTDRDLAASEAAYRQLMTRMPLPVIIVRDDRIEYANLLADERLGQDGATLVGRHAAEFMDTDALEAMRGGAPEGTSVNAWLNPEDGMPFEAELALSDYRDSRGRGTLAIVRDVTQQRRYEERLNHQATHDELTGLPNRRALREKLEQLVGESQRDGSGLMVLFVDLDHFKFINDALGHALGDQVLRDITLKLGDVLDGLGHIGRFGGDEFVAMLPFTCSPARALDVLPRIQRAIEEPLEVGGTMQRLKCSIGVAFATRDGFDADTLIRNADTAMYDAKRSGRHTWKRYSADMHATAMARLTVLSRLSGANLDHELALAWQTQHSGDDGRVIGVEALLRWPSAPGDLSTPDKLVPLLEETGAIVQIGQWVLREACRQQRRLAELLGPDCRVAVNISAQQLVHVDLVAEVRQALAETGASASSLELELTESAFMNEPARAIRTLHELRAMGVSIALDDFGTGYSNLTYLSRLPLDKIKIDRHFTSALLQDDVDASICRSIVFLAHSLNLQVVAEGVETERQRRWLLDEACTAMQGFFFSRPVSIDELGQRVRELRSN